MMTLGPLYYVVNASRSASMPSCILYVWTVRTQSTPTTRTAHASHGPLDWIAAFAILHFGLRRRNVLAARGCGIAVVHDDGNGIVLVEHGISDAAGQAVVPEAAVPHDGYGAFAPLAAAQRRPARGPQPIAHDARAHIEGRQRRKGVAADVPAHMHPAQFLLHDFHRREKRPLGAAGAQARRPQRH